MTTRRTRGPHAGGTEPTVSAAGGSGSGAARSEPSAEEKLRQARHAILELEERLQAAESRATEAEDRRMRAAAEMDNMRKRHRQEQADRLQFANSELVTKLLPVLDNFERALDHAPAEPDEDGPLTQWVSGLRLVERQLRDLLESEGVVGIEALGQRFDPAFHQAVVSEPSAEFEEGTVIGELQRGYVMNDRVLRPSLVKVARTP